MKLIPVTTKNAQTMLRVLKKHNLCNPADEALVNSYKPLGNNVTRNLLIDLHFLIKFAMELEPSEKWDTATKI